MEEHRRTIENRKWNSEKYDCLEFECDIWHFIVDNAFRQEVQLEQQEEDRGDERVFADLCKGKITDWQLYLKDIDKAVVVFNR